MASLRSEPRQDEPRPVGDPPLVLGLVGVDRAVEVARARPHGRTQLRLDLVGRAGEHEPLAQVGADAEPVGELDVLGLLLLARMAVALQVVRLADLEQRRLELLGDELVLDARVGEVERERRRRPGAVGLRLARLLVGPPERREPDLEVVGGPAALARARVEQLERRGDDLGADPEADDDAVGDLSGEPKRTRRVGSHDDRDAAGARPRQRQRVAVPVGAPGLEQAAHGEDVRLQLGEPRGPHAEVPDAGAAGADADVDAAGCEVVDGRRAAAVTSGWRESGFVTQVPIRIRSVSRATEASVVQGSRKSAGESQMPKRS